jgi:hypothetical protein
MHEVVQERHRAFETRAASHGLPKSVNGAQRVHARADCDVRAHVHPQRFDLGRVKRELEGHIVDHRHQGVIGVFDAGGPRALAQRLEELRHDRQVLLDPRLCASVRQVEVQPDEVSAVPGLRRLQPGNGLVQANGPACLLARKQKTANQSVLVRAVGDVHPAIRTGLSTLGCPPRCTGFSQKLAVTVSLTERGSAGCECTSKALLTLPLASFRPDS